MLTVLTHFAVAPEALGGVWLRGRQGPVRDRTLLALKALNVTRLSPSMGDDELFGGTDMVATLASRRLTTSPGLLEAGGVFCLATAETATTGFSARLGQRLDAGGAALIALDESQAEGSRLSGVLADRLGLFLSLDQILWSQTDAVVPDADVIAKARRALPRIAHRRQDVADLVRTAEALGISSLRAPRLALVCARVSASLRGAARLESPDLETACALVLAHRATRLPAAGAVSDPGMARAAAPAALVAAARGRLSHRAIATLRAQSEAGEGADEETHDVWPRMQRRGRSMPSRAGRPGGDRRLDIAATLRAAAPWQAMRRSAMVQPQEGVIVHRGDLRLRRHRESTDRVVIFVVDASAGQMPPRVADARGAVEILLGRVGARRDQAALIAFRDKGARELLAPTRSLVQGRQRLAGLAAGGPAPVAHGLRAAHDCARRAHALGMKPLIVLLTDARATIALDGTPSRRKAGADAKAMAKAIAGDGIETVVIDTGRMMSAQLGALGSALRARVVALPHADAAAMVGVLMTVLSGRP